MEEWRRMIIKTVSILRVDFSCQRYDEILEMSLKMCHKKYISIKVFNTTSILIDNFEIMMTSSSHWKSHQEIILLQNVAGNQRLKTIIIMKSPIYSCHQNPCCLFQILTKTTSYELWVNQGCQVENTITIFSTYQILLFLSFSI